MSDETSITPNRERGEIGITVNDRTYVLKLSMNAAVTLERKLKMPIGKLLQRTAELDFDAIREIVFVLLQKYHANEFKNPDAAGNFIDDAGGIGAFFTALAELQEVNAAPAGGDGANPPKAQSDGTGDSSTSEPALSV